MIQDVGNADARPPLLVIGQGPTGIEVALALAESGKCSVCLGDDALANADWREAASCLLEGYRRNGPITSSASATAAARGGARKAVTRSQYMAALLTSLSKQIVRALSPVGDASIVERFKVVVMTDPALPHAIAFNEHARAVGCGFVLAEALGATGRFFQDFGRPTSRSLREALLNPRFRTQANACDRSNSVDDVPSRTPTPAVLRKARRDTGAAQHLRPCQGSLSARESVTSGLLSASEYELQQTKSERLTAEEARSFCRHVQLHLCFAALHVFKQEHGHLPIALDRDQANEVVRIAEELLEIGRNVPAGFSPQPASIDVALCRRVAGISRVPVPSVSFQLGGLVAATALDLVEAYCSQECSRGNFEGRLGGDSALTTKEHPPARGEEPASQWFLVDELDSGVSGRDPGRVVEWMGCHTRADAASTDPLPLKAWLGTDLSNKFASARIAVIGCGRLGRDVARCLLHTGACTNPRGRMVFIDHRNDSSISTSSSPGTAPFHAECDGIQGRAGALRGLVSGHIGPGGSRVSAFGGAVQDTDTEIDLWEGVDAVVMCAGRRNGGEGRGGRGGGTTGGAGGSVGGCEALVRFVSHKCVLHGKPLVWGWAGGGGEGGAGVEVMAPCRTSCLVCSSHGGVKELIERRTSSSAKAMPSLDGRARHASCSTPRNCGRDGSGGEAWDPKGCCFGVARSAVAGVMVAELAKVLKPRCGRDDLRNWTLKVDSGCHFSSGGGPSRSSRSGDDDDKTKEGGKPHPTTPESNCGLVVGQQAGKSGNSSIRPVVSLPDPPLMVLSTSFDPFSGDSLRAIPEGFTEWGVEEIRPSVEVVSSPRLPHADVGNRFSLRTLISLVSARFGVDAKSVAAAAPGSECRVGAGGCQARGGASGGNILWAEWEKKDERNDRRQDGRRTGRTVCKMDQNVLSLWQQRVLSSSTHGEARRRVLCEGKEPRFLFLDVRGVMGEENAVLPILKYWVR
ncbi:unnamed protein product [Ectocarpus fasciculatus]